MSIRRFLIACAWLGAAAAPAIAAVYDVSAPPLPDDTYGVADFRMYVPEGVTTIRGVYVHLEPYLADSRPIVDDPHLRALCDASSFALLGALLDSRHMDTGIGAAVLRGLAQFADASGRPELAWSALYFDGWSWGGQFAYHFTVWRPDRVLGFVTQKGGLHDTTPAGDAILVPGCLIVGELDAPYRIANLTGIFLAHRPLGARWWLAMQPGAGHERIQDRAWLDAIFRAVAAGRLPAVIPPQGPVTLRELAEDQSWLGERASAWIGPHPCFLAPTDTACWLPTRDVALGWQSFVSAGAVSDTFACATAVAEERRVKASLGPNSPNPFNAATVVPFALAAAADVELAVFDLRGRRVRVLLAGSQPAGRHVARWDGTDADGQRVAAGTYLYRLRYGNGFTSRHLTLVP